MRFLPISFVALILSAALFYFAACIKRDKDCCSFPGAKAPLTGKWSLKTIYGGFAGSVVNIPVDSPIYLTLSSDSTYTVHHFLYPVESGVYHLCDTPIYSNTPQRAIVFTAIGTTNRYIEPPTSLRISHDSLFLGEDFDDDFGRIYVKVN
jgi:hypothetical protein